MNYHLPRMMKDKPKITLFVTCLVDQLLPEVGVATVKLLRRAGCAVEFPKEQTCCGQPFYNSGFRREAKRLARRTIDLLTDKETVVLPSGSCTTMIRKEYPHLFEDEPKYYYRALRLARKTFELGEFLSKQGDGSNQSNTGTAATTPLEPVTYHDSCHMCRMLGLRDEPRRALKQSGYSIAEMEESDRCCGFGGVFSIRMPEVSNAMTAEKLRQAKETDVSTLVTSDPGCLMQMRGLLKDDDDLQIEHIATMLARKMDKESGTH